jgi:hypothetical protein
MMDLLQSHILYTDMRVHPRNLPLNFGQTTQIKSHQSHIPYIMPSTLVWRLPAPLYYPSEKIDNVFEFIQQSRVDVIPVLWHLW